MGAFPTDHHSSFACKEQSLRQSFSAIHRSPSDAALRRLLPESNRGNKGNIRRSASTATLRRTLPESKRGSTGNIHHSPSDATLHRFLPESTRGSNGNLETHQECPLKRDHRGKPIRSKSILRCNRRSSLSTVGPSSTGITSAHFEELLEVRFSIDEVPQPHHQSARERLARNFQRGFVFS